ncbi:Putative cutinase/acetylxylan esterase, alpha/Beta hydrolase, cutinase, serine active [Septoria linicola]|uniref:Cutinase n=1 Tax=Septoria linicola TaxID=215465 RepID=A0A9Q9AEG3_9PEZI|nr:Putative cutinase/acetylxylan esterase, alpha/Beta hydrolase, cutinase, serine active [Septoria linicola]
MFLSPALVALLTVTAQAFPTADPVEANAALVARQTIVSAELDIGPCCQITFIFARGSTEAGNMGAIVGADTCRAMKARFGSTNVACQGVGFPYAASLIANTFARGTSPAAIGEATRLFRLASTKCPNTIVTTGGYSQGSAVIAASLSDLQQQAPAVANQVAGAVLFGYTRNQQNGGRIPSYPTQRTKVFCASGDGVCDGTLNIRPPHFSYGRDAGAATDFLAQRIAAARG